MGSGLLRERLILEKIASFFWWGGGLRDGSGCANCFASKSHGLDSRMRICRYPVQTVVIVQVPNAHGKVELLTLTPSGSSAFRKCTQLRILGAQEVA